MSTKGGTTGYRKGDLYRQLDPVTAFTLVSGGGGDATGIVEQRLRLKGFNANLTISIGAAVVPPSGSNQIELPVLPGTFEAIPAMRHPDSDYIFLRPLKLIPPNIPYQYVIGVGHVSGADDGIAAFGDIIEFRVVVDTAQWSQTVVDGSIKIAARVDYTGAWWNPDTIARLIGDVTFEGVEPISISTGGE